MDWVEAAYETEVEARTGQATVVHRLSKAPVLEQLIEDGDAAWATEVRCPKTLMAKIQTSAEARQIVKWDLEDVDHEVFVMPGLVAVRDFSMRLSGLSSVYEGAGELRVSRGYWLAKGETWRASTLLESLLTFILSPDLEKGRLAVAPDEGGGHFRFLVQMAADVYECRDDRTVRIAALVGACAQFSREFQRKDDEEEEPQVARMLRDHLRSKEPNISLWDEPESYDPALVATLLEPFRLRPVSDGGDGE